MLKNKQMIDSKVKQAFKKEMNSNPERWEHVGADPNKIKVANVHVTPYGTMEVSWFTNHGMISAEVGANGNVTRFGYDD